MSYRAHDLAQHGRKTATDIRGLDRFNGTRRLSKREGLLYLKLKCFYNNAHIAPYEGRERVHGAGTTLFRPPQQQKPPPPNDCASRARCKSRASTARARRRGVAMVEGGRGEARQGVEASRDRGRLGGKGWGTFCGQPRPRRNGPRQQWWRPQGSTPATGPAPRWRARGHARARQEGGHADGAPRGGRGGRGARAPRRISAPRSHTTW